MSIPIKRVPVRVQVWHDGVRLDFRYWLDELTIDNDLIPARWPLSSFRGANHDLTLKAHSDAVDGPWKFHRGKPAIGE